MDVLFRFNVKTSNTRILSKTQGWKLVVVTPYAAKVHVEDGTHVSRDGTVMSTRVLAKMLSNGFDRTPARPFMADYKRDRKEFILKAIRLNCTWTHKAVNPNQQHGRMHTVYVFFASTKCAEMIKDDLVHWLEDGNYYRTHVPNAPMTIAQKGHDTPLIDLHQLVQSIKATSVRI